MKSKKRPDPVPSPRFRIQKLEEERDKAQALAEAADRLSFEDLLRFYWEITPTTPRPAAERYVRYAMDGAERGSAHLRALDAGPGGRWTGETMLDIGCGTGGFLLAAADRFTIKITGKQSHSHPRDCPWWRPISNTIHHQRTNEHPAHA